LQRDVALIEEEIWKAGPEKVAEKIAEIELKIRRRLDPQQLHQQAVRLVASPKATVAIAEHTAALIEDAIAAYRSARGHVNALPDELEALSDLPARLREIGSLSQDGSNLKELEERLEAFASRIADLTLKLEAAARLNTRKIVREQALKTVTTAVVGGTITTMVAATSHILGLIDVGDMLERLSAAGEQLPTYDPPISPLPPATDV